MATTTLTATDLDYGEEQDISQGGGTAINAANTMRVLYPKNGKLLILIDSDHADTAATFKAGGENKGGFLAAGLGDWTPTAPGDTKLDLIMIDSDRFKDMDGYVYWTWATNSAGFVRVFNITEKDGGYS
jgi:hypothetical protein